MKRICGLIIFVMGLFLLVNVVWESDVVGWLSNRSNLEKSIPVDHIDFIQVNASSADIKVVPSDQDELKVVLTGRDTKNVHLNVDRGFDKASINIETKWYAYSFIPHQIKLFVYVPKHLQTSMKIGLTSGNVEIGSSKGATWNLDNLDTDMSFGKCELIHLKLNKWRHDGATGDVSGHQVSSKETTLNMSSGNINLSYFSGVVNLSLTSGNVILQLDQLMGDIKTNVTSGNVSLDLPKEVAFTLKSNVAADKIKSSFPLQFEKQTDETTTSTYGIGKYQILANLMSGDLTIY